MNYEKYAFTIKDNRREQSDYFVLFDIWQKKGCSILCKYPEQDSKGRLHYHGIMTIPKGIYRKTLCPKQYHFMLKPLTDEEGWLRYCKKDQQEEEDVDTNENELLSSLKVKLF